MTECFHPDVVREMDRCAAVQWQRDQRQDDYWHDIIHNSIPPWTRPVSGAMITEAIRILERQANATHNYESANRITEADFWQDEYWRAERELRQFPDTMLWAVTRELLKRKYYRLLSWVREYYDGDETFSSCNHGKRVWFHRAFAR